MSYPRCLLLAASILVVAVSSQEVDPMAIAEENRDCKLLGPFSLLIQLALGALALLALVYKRWKERPQRPLKIWAFDVSKQVFGSGMLHLANVFMSMISAGEFDIAKKYNANPCSYYLLNLGIDVGFFFFFFSVSATSGPTTNLFSPPLDHPGDTRSHVYTSNPELDCFVYFIRRSAGVHRIR